MTDDSNIPWDMLAYYLSNETTAGEKSEVERWIAENPEHRALVAKFRKSWENAKDPVRPPLDVAAIKQQIVSRVAVPAKSAHQTNPENRVSKLEISDQIFQFDAPKYGLFSGLKLRRWVGYAITAAVIGLVAFVQLPLFQSHIINQPQLRTYKTERGQYAKIALPDGSTVRISPATTVSYSDDFGRTNREIMLNGGALFTVVNGGQPPFIVKTDEASSRVLGTTFAVRKFFEDSVITVVVAEGKVEVVVAGNSEKSVLTMGDKLEIGSGPRSLKRGIDISTALGWATGRLDFRDTPFSVVLTEVSRTYNLNIHVSSRQLANRTVSGVIEHLSPESVIGMLAAISGSRAVRSGTKITFEDH